MAGKTSLYCVYVMISFAAIQEDASILFFWWVFSLLFLFRCASGAFLLLTFHSFDRFFLGGGPDPFSSSPRDC